MSLARKPRADFRAVKPLLVFRAQSAAFMGGARFWLAQMPYNQARIKGQMAFASDSDDALKFPPWQATLFGGLRILFRGQPVSAPPFRSQALLSLLLLHPTKHKREQLAGGLFPDSPEDTAKARLSDRLWLLKNHLPEFPLVSTATEICIEEGQVWVDVDEFRLLTRKGDPTSLARAIELYRGDLLPEQDADWLLLERENLYLSYVRALQSLSAQFLKSGDPLQAIPLLEKLYFIEPFDENNLRGLLRAYQAFGQRGASLEQTASLMNVSLRTIQRDINTLEVQGELP
jgi:DNA-binding SARP family transcriptional activator